MTVGVGLTSRGYAEVKKAWNHFCAIFLSMKWPNREIFCFIAEMFILTQILSVFNHL